MAVGDKIRKEAAERLRKEKEFECPDPTTDVKVNTANRKVAIDDYAYGPADPREENKEFWQEKADIWGTDIDDVYNMRCGNCRVFDVTPWIQDCIGPVASQDDDYFATEGVEIGYCRIHEFKCASTRTCDTWVAGGPMNSEIETSEIEEARERGDLG